jgi:hypothetical protein
MAVQGPMLTLIDLIGRARKAESAAELRFLQVNDTHAQAAYRQLAQAAPFNPRSHLGV